MAKSAAKTRSVEDMGSVEQMAEPERLAAISKVRIAYESLAHIADRSEANRRRVKLLEVWRDLVTMREAEQGAAVPDAEHRAPADDAEPIAPVQTAEAIVPLQTDHVDEVVEESPSPAVQEHMHDETIESLSAHPPVVDIIIDEVETDASHRAHEEAIQDVELHAHGEDLVIAETKHSGAEPVDVVIAETAPFPKKDIEIFRVRLRLLKSGIVHDTLLPEGTIVSVYPADAEDLVNQGTAEILLDQEDED